MEQYNALTYRYDEALSLLWLIHAYIAAAPFFTMHTYVARGRRAETSEQLTTWRCNEAILCFLNFCLYEERNSTFLFLSQIFFSSINKRCTKQNNNDSHKKLKHFFSLSKKSLGQKMFVCFRGSEILNQCIILP